MWQKGQSGNPTGRPKQRNVIEIVREKMNCNCELAPGLTWQEALAMAELEQALKDPIARKNLFDRLYGKPTEAIELSGNAGAPLILKVVYDSGDKRDFGTAQSKETTPGL